MMQAEGLDNLTAWDSVRGGDSISISDWHGQVGQ